MAKREGYEVIDEWLEQINEEFADTSPKNWTRQMLVFPAL